MSKYNTFFFYYTLLLMTILTLGSVFFYPAPLNLIQPIALAPAGLFFWLKATDPQGATETQWSGRFVIAIAILSCLGIFGLYLMSDAKEEIEGLRTQITSLENESPDQTASISAELAMLRQELANMQNEEVETTDATQSSSTEILDLLNSLSTPTPTPEPSLTVAGEVRLRGSSAVNVYEESNLSSKIIGVAEPGIEYTFFESFGEWYLIELGNKTGWVQAKDFTEI